MTPEDGHDTRPAVRAVLHRWRASTQARMHGKTAHRGPHEILDPMRRALSGLGTWPLVLCFACTGSDDDGDETGVGTTTDTHATASGTGTSTTSATAGTGGSTSPADTDTGADTSTTDTTASTEDSGDTNGAVEPPACDFFFDDFSTGDTSFSDNGFSWQNQDFAVTDGFGHGDDHALLFSFGPDAPGEDSTSELRFELGHEVQQLWIELWVYYPDGTEGLGSARYEHRDDESSDNNKFLRLWSGDYNSRPKVGASTLPMDEPAGDSRLINEYNPVGSGMGNFGSGSATWVTDDTPVTCRRGQWCQVRMHYVVADVGQSNGEARWWIDGELVYENTELPNAAESESDNVLDRGYLLGWANSGFTELTHVYVDDVTFCDTDPGF